MKAIANFFATKRGWSRLKDEILGTYLRPYLAKIAKTKRPVVIVDCFAGKGLFDDGERGSPLIIADAIRTQMQPASAVPVRAVFIERKYHGDLTRNVAGYEECEVLSGTYEDHLPKLARSIDRNTNLLLFVDPYGIKSLDFRYFRDLAELGLRSLELILNLNTLGFLREGCRLLSIGGFECEEDSDVDEEDPDSPNSIERMNAIACGPYWQTILGEYHAGKLSMHDAEARFSELYLSRLRELFRYVIDIPVQYKRNNLPKYRLIYGTESDDGLILMADKMSRAWHEFVERDRGGQAVLFESIDYPDMVALKGYSLDDDIMALTADKIELKRLIVKLMTKYGITFPKSKLCSRIKGMESDGLLRIQRHPDRTRTGRLTRSMDYRKYHITIERA